ncbi:MAG: polysaccharide biosynthesis protein [Clostridiales bacterium]|nr:polysaccharide biosynthesis protein [Clostridiales bacterium]
MQKKSLIKGTLILAISGIIAKFLGFFFRIPLIYMIGEEGIGLYQLTYPLYTFLLALASGIPTAISKMISERMAVNKSREAFRVFRVALVTLVVFGGISTLFIIIFSSEIIKMFQWNRDVYYSLLGIALAPLFTSILSAYRGYFQGFQYMTPPAVSQVIEQITRVVVGVGLASLLLSQGIQVAAGGASFGAVAGAIVGLLFLIYFFSKNKLSYSQNQECASPYSIFKQIIKIAVPISIGHAIGSVMALIDSMMVPGLLRSAGYNYQMATILYGQLTGKAFVLINVPLTLSVALAQCIVPAISESFALNNIKKLKRNVLAAFKLAIILALPCCAGLYALAKPILTFVFQGRNDGWQLMQILSIAAIFIIIAQTATGILNGIGKTILPVIAMIVGCIIKILISIVFIPIPSLNISAAAYGTLFAYGIVALLDVTMVIRYLRVKINIKEVVISPIICTIVMIFSVVIIYVNMYNLTSKNSLAVTASIFLGAILYFIMLLITKTMSIKDIREILKKR